MAVASTRRTLSGILLLTLVAALAGACSPPNGVGTGGPEDTATPDVRIDAEIQDPDIVGEETPTEDLVIPPDGDEDSEVTEECPESKCLIGKVSCPTATIALTCEPVDDKSCPGVGAWDAGETCPAGSTCMENQGCTCQLGSCTGEDLESCLSPDGLKACQEWACQDGCCVVQDMEDCCATASDCEDGDLCTQDLCDQESHTCQFKSKLEMGLCDDGDSCTVDGCDSETGICTHELDTGTGCVVFCYGSTATLAVETHCGIDPCAEPQCMFEGPFVPWDEAYAPDCDGADADSCGVCDFSTPKSCDDGDPCTIDGCTPQEGCTHELDTQNPACFCVTTADCLPLIDGTCQTVSCLVSQQVCVKKPKDCEDGHPCTIDFCDEETNQCVHNLDEQNPECEGLELCYGQAWCDGYLVEKYGEGCACKAASCSLVTGTDYGVCVEQDTGCDDQDPCTADFCGFDGQVCGCDHAPVDCDDGDPCTADQCSPVQGCIHPPLDVNDGNPCTADSCNPNSPLTGYQVHTPVVCAEKPCKVGQCNTSTGLCNYTAKSCEEVPADPCTVDTCNQSTGLCVHTPKVCNDYNKCTVDFCNPGTGDCDTQPVDCNDNNPCTDDICNEVTGSCMHPPTYVNDFNACTLDSCKPSTGPVYEPVDCTDCVHPVTKETIACPGGNGPPGFQPEICTSDLCAPMSGCYHVPIMNVAAGCGGCLDEDTG
ncbi:MAG: hypothetical protein FJ098_08835, partial [Deltaproteobacteria bacterium]|nr:hypothetical protein [Deltaproteobacteria bacterium]